VRLENQREALLEETRIKLSSVVSELLGLSGRRILAALAAGASDPVELAKLGDRRLRCSREELAHALRGQWQPLDRQMLKLFLERLDVLDRQSQQLDQMAAAAMRLAEVPGFGPDSAQQTIAEVGAYARSFDSSAQFASWAAVCPGRQKSAEHNHSSRSPKGSQKEGLPFSDRVSPMDPQARLPCRHLGHRPQAGPPGLEDSTRRGQESAPAIQRRRANKMIRALRSMGYQVEISSLNPQPALG
jgi:hypothetical protein